MVGKLPPFPQLVSESRISNEPSTVGGPGAGPDVVTFNALISCCEKARSWQKAGGRQRQQTDVGWSIEGDK